MKKKNLIPSASFPVGRKGLPLFLFLFHLYCEYFHEKKNEKGCLETLSSRCREQTISEGKL